MLIVMCETTLMNKTIFLILVSISLFGCSAEFEDISDSSKYVQYLGVEYETTKDLLIYGYTLKLEKNKKLDGFAIYAPPSVASGPEFLSKEILPKGSVFSIIKIQKCSNCFPFSAYIQFLIKFKGLEKYNNYKVSFKEGVFNIKNEVFKKH